MIQNNIQYERIGLATEKSDFLTGLPLNNSGAITGDSKMSKLIPLTQGQFAIIDAENYKWLNQFRWHAQWSKNTKSFYAVRKSRKENGKQYQIYIHREILGLKRGDKRQSDHKNHNPLDNRISNLRIVTYQQNQFNQKNPKGYRWHKVAKKYQARIRVNDKLIHLGLFCTSKEARKAYIKAKKIYHKF